MRPVFSLFLGLALMASTIVSSMAKVEYPGLYKFVAKKALQHKAPLNIPTRITDKKQIEKLISKIKNKDLVRRIKEDIQRTNTKVNVTVDWTEKGFSVTQGEQTLEVNLSNNTLLFRGHSFNLNPDKIRYKKLQNFLEKHAQTNSITMLNAFIPTAHAFEPVNIIMGVVALAIYVPMVKDFSSRVCKRHREDISDEIEELKNSCQSDMAMLEEGSHPRERFDTQTRIEKLKEMSTLIGQDGKDYSCKEKLPEEIQCINKDHKEYIDKTCKSLEKLSSCLNKFEKISPTSVNQSRRDRSGHRPISGRPSDTFRSHSEER